MIRLDFLATLVLRNFVHDTEFCTLLVLFLGFPLWNLMVERWRGVWRSKVVDRDFWNTNELMVFRDSSEE